MAVITSGDSPMTTLPTLDDSASISKYRVGCLFNGSNDHSVAAHLEEFDGGFNLGSHAPGREMPCSQVFFGLLDRQFVEQSLIRFAEIERNLVGAGKDDQHLGANFVRQQCRGAILVDDRIDTFQCAVLFDIYRNSATAGGNHNDAVVDKGLNDLAFDDLLRGIGEAPRAANRDWNLLSSSSRVRSGKVRLLAPYRTDRYTCVGLFKLRVVLIDLDLSDDGHDFALDVVAMSRLNRLWPIM